MLDILSDAEVLKILKKCVSSEKVYSFQWTLTKINELLGYLGEYHRLKVEANIVRIPFFTFINANLYTFYCYRMANKLQNTSLSKLCQTMPNKKVP